MAKKRRADETADEYAEDYENDEVLDDADSDPLVAPVRYEISSYGIDFDVKGLVGRLRDEKILIPAFQRSFVWRLPDSSSFIESLLLGLPVPGVFLAKEPDSQKLFVIDGQQRLKSLLYFYDGVFNPDSSKTHQRPFRLTKVQQQFEGLTYGELLEQSRQLLDDSVIHATVVKQDRPANDETSIYHVFARLNSGGRRLHPQEIRSASFHGSLISAIRAANEDPHWRALFGKKSPRLKDEEMILRFLALWDNEAGYERPMEEFLNRFAARFQHASSATTRKRIARFTQAAKVIHEMIGEHAFRPERNFNAAVFDSVMIGISAAIETNSGLSATTVRRAYDRLIKSSGFVESTSRSTADKPFVHQRIKLAKSAFARGK